MSSIIKGLNSVREQRKGEIRDYPDERSWQSGPGRDPYDMYSPSADETNYGPNNVFSISVNLNKDKKGPPNWKPVGIVKGLSDYPRDETVMQIYQDYLNKFKDVGEFKVGVLGAGPSTRPTHYLLSKVVDDAKKMLGLTENQKTPKLDPDRLAREAFKIVKQIGYDHTVPQILIELETLAEENLPPEKIAELKQAEDRVFEARNHLESEIYKLSEIFAKDPYTDEDDFEDEDYDLDELREEAKKKVYKIKSARGEILELDNHTEWATREAAEAALASLDIEPSEREQYRIISITTEGQIYSTGGGAGQSYRKIKPKKRKSFSTKQDVIK